MTDHDPRPSSDKGVELPASFLPYPKSTLSPRIVPNDLTTFKSRGVSQVQKETAQKLAELKKAYDQIVEDFNWNKFIYESRFGFEPVIGEHYFLYQDNKGPVLSLIEPERWKQKTFIGEFQLSVGGHWTLVRLGENISPRELFDRVE